MRLSTLRLGTGTHATALLHGFLGSGKNLRTLAQRWSEADPSRIFLLPDLRGHGTSPALAPTTDLSEMAKDVLETASAEGLTGPLTLVGHSLGGRVALAAARMQPQALDAVALLDISPSAIASEQSESGAVLGRLLRAPAQAKDRREMRAWLMGERLSGPLADWLVMNLTEREGGVAWRFDREALRQLHERVNREDLWDAVEARAVPIRCFRGERSGYVSDADAARLERAGCPVTTLAGAGHYVHVDALEPLLSGLSA